MASGKLEVLFSEYRPCLVKGHKALFHRFADNARVVGASALRGGHNAGQLWAVVAIVEYENGTVHECYPDEVRFLDSRGKFAEYDFSVEEESGNAERL